MRIVAPIPGASQTEQKSGLSFKTQRHLAQHLTHHRLIGQILAERQAAQISLRSDVGLLASELAEKLVGEHLENTDLTARVVDRFLDELEAEEIPVGGVN